jgi:hypothetical protein
MRLRLGVPFAGAVAIVLLGLSGLSGLSGVAARSKPGGKVVVTGHVCRGGAPKPVVLTNLPTAPDQSLLAILGVLRRPQVPTDIPPPSTLRDPALQGVEVAYERLLARTDHGERFFLIPAFFAPPAIPTTCKPPFTPQELHQQQALQQQVALHPHFLLFLTELTAAGAQAGGGGAASTAAQILAGGAQSSSFGSGGPAGRYETQSGTIDGLVPDGVASVEFVYRHRPPRTLAVTGNFFELSVSGRVRRPKLARSPSGLPVPRLPQFPPTSGPLAPIAPVAIVWHDAHGAVIKSIRQPAYCAPRRGKSLDRCLGTLLRRVGGPPASG